MHSQILYGEWYKSGKGSSCEFDMEPYEIQCLFEATLPFELSSYDFIFFDPVWEGGHVVAQTATVIGIEDLSKEILEREKSGNTVQAFLRIKSIHDTLDFSVVRDPDAYCSLNGFPLLQRSFGLWPSGCKNQFQFIGKVYNAKTGQVVEHTESRKVFEKLRRQFRKHSVPYFRRPPSEAD